MQTKLRSRKIFITRGSSLNRSDADLESAINLNGSVDELDAVLSIVLLVTKTLASAKPIEEEGSALVSFVQKYGLAHWLSNMSRNLRLDDS